MRERKREREGERERGRERGRERERESERERERVCPTGRESDIDLPCLCPSALGAV